LQNTCWAFAIPLRLFVIVKDQTDIINTATKCSCVSLKTCCVYVCTCIHIRHTRVS